MPMREEVKVHLKQVAENFKNKSRAENLKRIKTKSTHSYTLKECKSYTPKVVYQRASEVTIRKTT